MPYLDTDLMPQNTISQKLVDHMMSNHHGGAHYNKLRLERLYEIVAQISYHHR